TEVKELLRGKVCAFTGNTGVGKSSFLNRLAPQLALKTANISQKLGRGRHTTRHVELFRLEELDCYVADTPGFSTMDLARYDVILKEDLQYCFREFAPYLSDCRFTGCSHTVEKGCAVLKALDEGKIEPSRHESYKALYEEAKQIKEWEL
ncbi:MAG: ribosome small subunit-dependent GTPase A, partial [Clostridiales bacterium]|nr:ribosome small subunit-dependent GTPase A [Clostridiales bacterium]